MPLLCVYSYSDSDALKGGVEQTKSKRKKNTKECSAHCMCHDHGS